MSHSTMSFPGGTEAHITKDTGDSVSHNPCLKSPSSVHYGHRANAGLAWVGLQEKVHGKF